MPEFVSTVELLVRVADRARDRVAHTVVDPDPAGRPATRDLTFGEWLRRSRSLSAEIRAGGARVAAIVGSRAAYPEIAIAFLAAHLAGAVPTILPGGSGEEALRRLVAEVGADVVLAAPPGVDTALGVPVLDADAERADADTATQVAIAPEDTGAIVFTSGTTGRPEAIAIPHADLTFEAHATDAPQASVTPDAAFLHCFPVHVVDGHFMALRPLLRGLRVVTLPSFDACAWWRAVEALRVTDLNLVPTMARELVDESGRRPYDLSSLERVVVGSAPLSAEVAEGLRRVLPGAALWQDYSLTESGTAGAGGPLDPLRPGLVGLAYEGCEIRISGEGEILLCRPGEPARRRWVRGALGPSCAGPDGWIATGDLGFLDAEGRLTLVGRAKDVISVGGLKVHAGEVEAALEALPGVRGAGVIGVEHALLGEEVVGVVERDGDVPVDGLLTALRRTLPEWKVPAGLMVTDRLPRTPTGKIDRPALRRLWGRLSEVATLLAPAYDPEVLPGLLAAAGVAPAATGPEASLAMTSLQAVRLRGRFLQEFGLDVPLRLLLAARTTSELTVAISELAAQ